MKKEDFTELLGDIHENFVQETEIMKAKKPVWRKWAAIAACLCLIAVSAYAVPKMMDPGPSGTPVPDPDGTLQREMEPNVSPNHPILVPDDEGYINPDVEPAENLRTPWTVHFNEASAVLSADRAYIKGYFTEELDGTALAALEPEMRLEYMTYSGRAGFDNFGNLLDVVLSVTTSVPGHPVTIGIADNFFGSCYVLPGEEQISVCGKVEYRAYQYELGDTVTLAADAIINDLYFHFSMDTAKAQLEQAKTDFQGVLECFAYYEEGKPDLSVIEPEEIPELMEQMFDTLAQARTEPDFGKYLPSELPAGFEESAIRRFKFQNADYLSALWSRGLDDLAWMVSPYTEVDAHRLTGVNEKENYDLSLYPIPRADSVPAELRETVDNPIFDADELTLEAVYCRAYKVDDAGDTDGWRMDFSVRYGDIIVEIHAKGVDPEWVYRQLMMLK